MRIDAHQHFWRYTPDEYPWITADMQSLRQDFLPEDLFREMASADIQASIAVQARQTLQETEWLLELAEQSSRIAGVIGWAPIASETFSETLEDLQSTNLLKGLRHVVQAEAAGFLDGKAFNRGIAEMRKTGLVYEILIVSPQMEDATRFVDRHPNQLFVLDHIGKPRIAQHGLHSWATAIREMARRKNVICKLSGMVTEADWTDWSSAELHHYFEIVLEAFGPSRLMVGSDWPVLTLACGYGQWWEMVAQWIVPLSASERRLIEGDVAARVYGLEVHSARSERSQ